MRLEVRFNQEYTPGTNFRLFFSYLTFIIYFVVYRLIEFFDVALWEKVQFDKKEETIRVGLAHSVLEHPDESFQRFMTHVCIFLISNWLQN